MLFDGLSGPWRFQEEWEAGCREKALAYCEPLDRAPSPPVLGFPVCKMRELASVISKGLKIHGGALVGGESGCIVRTDRKSLSAGFIQILY